MMQEHDDPISVCRLFEKTSKTGNQYFTGRWGNAKVLLFKSREIAEDGSPIWELKLAQAAPYKPKAERAASAPPVDDGYDGPDVSNEGPAPANFDDVIPF